MEHINITALILCLLLNVYFSTAAIQFITAKDPDHPFKCYFKGPPKIEIPFNNIKRVSNRCEIYRCHNDYLITQETCGSVGSSTHCVVIKGNPGAPYPTCCDEFIC